MTGTLHPRDEVLHSHWGFGVVLGLRPGRRVRVRFAKQPGFPRTVRRDELVFIPAPARSPAETRPARPAARPASGGEQSRVSVEPAVRSPQRGSAQAATSWVSESIELPPPRKIRPRPRPEVPTASPARVSRELSPAELAGYRQTIEALRSGVVPAEHATEYTVGRDRQLAQLRELYQAGRGLRIIWGEYGTGKSHLLDVAEQIALAEGFVTSRITLDRYEIPPSHPQRLYSAIANHLRYPGEFDHGLEPLLQRLADSVPHRSPTGPQASRFLSPYLHALWKGDSRTIDWMNDYAHGSRVLQGEGLHLLSRIGWDGRPPLTLSDFRTYGRVYAHLVGNLASWARDAGFRGLVVLFDEVEFIDSMDRQLWEFASEVLAHYTAVTVPTEQLAFDPDVLYKGGHEVHRKIPLRFREDQPLSVIFALTPLPQIEAALHRMVHSNDHDIHVEALEREEALALVDRVEEVYLHAYPGFRISPELAEQIRDDIWRRIEEGDDGPRSIVRAVCHWLDSERVQ